MIVSILSGNPVQGSSVGSQGLKLFGEVSAKSYKVGAVGNNWLVGWLETTLRIFLIFPIKLGDYKGRKVT